MAGSPTWMAIVQRGEQLVYDRLKQYEDGGLVEVRWDRRRADRPEGTEPAAAGLQPGGRRGARPPMWSAPGFVLVPHPEDRLTTEPVRISA